MPGNFTRTFVSLASSTLHRREAQEQGGLLNGKDPTAFNTSDPLRLWIIQVGLIIMTAQLLSLLLRKLKQPKVIAEVLGGIILGPTAFGRIPGFTEHIFPKDSIPYLSLVANIGLVLFLFLVGLEIETSVIKKNARHSLPISLAGMCLPFGFGALLAIPLYHKFVDPSIKFTNFMLFTGVAYSITAFPVLCRILTELKLVDTTVGVVVLSAGVGNDIVGWTLLALSVALVNASSGLMALWILLTAVGWTLFLLLPVKRFFLWLAHHTGSIENGPSMFFMTVTILMVFASAFFTDVIGVHAIFGGFLAGLVVPREGGLAITLTEKLEDMVSIIFLPLYFTLSGLSTNLGLLDNGVTWGYTIAIAALAYSGKFGGCCIAARFSGFKWREASTIGTLMSCKGLVELIVLNVGLNANILSPTVFSMFVFEALLLTFMTTPVVMLIYPPEFRTRVTATGPDYAAAADMAGKDAERSESGMRKSRSSEDDEREPWKSRFTVVLDKIEHLPGMMTLTQLISPFEADEKERLISEKRKSNESYGNRALIAEANIRSNVIVDALRLIELSDRTSAVMRSSAADQLTLTDPLLAVFKTFGDLNDIPITSSLSVVTFGDLAHRVADHAQQMSSHLVLIPWLPPTVSIVNEADNHANAPSSSNTFTNPFDMLFKSSGVDKSASVVHSEFIRGVFAQCTTDVALYVDRTDRTRNISDLKGRFGKHHIFLPFFGGPDDRLALEFVVQLTSNLKITATVVRMTKSEEGFEENAIITLDKPGMAHVTGHDENQRSDTAQAVANMRANGMTVTSMTGHPDTVYGQFTTQTRLQSETADNIAWARYASPSKDSTHFARVTGALSRISFTELATPLPLHAVIEQTSTRIGEAAGRGENLFVVLGRTRRMAVENHQKELKQILDAYGSVGNEVKKTIGDVGTALVASSCNVGLVVLQAATRPSDI